MADLAQIRWTQWTHRLQVYARSLQRENKANRLTSCASPTWITQEDALKKLFFWGKVCLTFCVIVLRYFSLCACVVQKWLWKICRNLKQPNRIQTRKARFSTIMSIDLFFFIAALAFWDRCEFSCWECFHRSLRILLPFRHWIANIHFPCWAYDAMRGRPWWRWSPWNVSC